MRIHFFFGVDDDVESCDLLWNFQTLKVRLPRNVISIASDEAGNLFCLDLREQGRGRVLFWDRELEGAGDHRALKAVVASSFDEWLNQLTVRA
jgi:SMI1/KNR4 family protein SUKH-1